LTPFRSIHTQDKAMEFLRIIEPVCHERRLVVDLAGFRWLNSLELGVLTQLAKVCRKRGHRLVLCCVPRRIRELLQLFRLDNYVEMPRTLAELEFTLENLRHPAENGRAYVRMAGERLHILLPAEFGRDQVATLREEVLHRWKSGRVEGIAIDGSRTTFLDGPAAQMISELGRMVVKAQAAMWLRGFKDPILRFIRHEGLGRIGKSAPSPGWKSRRAVRPGIAPATA
jgi:anti-anti-sigma factor